MCVFTEHFTQTDGTHGQTDGWTEPLYKLPPFTCGFPQMWEAKIKMLSIKIIIALMEILFET